MALTEANLRRMAGVRQSLDSASTYSQRGHDALSRSFDRFGNLIAKPLWDRKMRKEEQEWQTGENEADRKGSLGLQEQSQQWQEGAYGEGGALYKDQQFDTQRKWAEWSMSDDPAAKKWREWQQKIAEIGLPMGEPPDPFSVIDFLGGIYDRFITDPKGNMFINPDGTPKTFTDDDWERFKAMADKESTGNPQRDLILSSMDAFIDMIKGGGGPNPIPEPEGEGGGIGGLFGADDKLTFSSATNKLQDAINQYPEDQNLKALMKKYDLKKNVLGSVNPRGNIGYMAWDDEKKQQFMNEVNLILSGPQSGISGPRERIEDETRQPFGVQPSDIQTYEPSGQAIPQIREGENQNRDDEYMSKIRAIIESLSPEEYEQATEYTNLLNEPGPATEDDLKKVIQWYQQMIQKYGTTTPPPGRGLQIN